MERPGLQALLTDVDAGKVDVVVVITRQIPRSWNQQRRLLMGQESGGGNE